MAIRKTIAFAAFLLFVATSAHGQYLYVHENTSPNRISGFRVAADGTLSAIPGSPFATGGHGGFCYNVGSVALSQAGRRIYSTDSTSGTVSGFNIGTGGVLTPVPGSPFPTTGGVPVGVTTNGPATLLFVGEVERGVTVYAIASNGALELVSGSPFGLADGLGFDVVYDGRRKLLFSNHYTAARINAFKVGADHSLRAIPGAPFQTPTVNNHKMALRPQGDLLFVAGGDSSGAAIFQIGADGSLGDAPGSPLALPRTIVGTAVAGSGKFVYFGSQSSADVFGYLIGPGGALTPLRGSPYASGGAGPTGLAADDVGRRLFAVNSSGNNVTSFSVSSDGVLAPIDNASIPDSSCPVGITYVPPPLRIETPNTPSRWGINTRQRLAWTYDGDASQFQIDISRDGGETWDFLSVVPNMVGGSQNFFWTVTGPATANARLRVTAIGDEEAADANDADIRIAPAAIEVVLPYRRTVLQFGTEFRVFWKHNLGARVPVAIEVSADGGTSWRTVTARTETTGSTTSSFRWSVDLLPTANGRFRIRALDGSGASAMSEVFTVSAPE